MHNTIDYKTLENLGLDYCELTSDGFLIVDSWESVEIVENNKLLPEGEKWGFNDEFTTCSSCNSAIRTCPTHYGWMPDFLVTESEGYLCKECITPDDVIEHAVNNSSRANTILTDEQLKNEGFVKLNDDKFIAGFEYSDNPKEVFEKYRDSYDEILFSIVTQGQFDVEFDVWTRNLDMEDY